MTSANLSQTLKSLYALQRRGIKMGLNHTLSLLKFLENPHKNLKIIHIAGTNGKGSTAATIYNILISSGYKVGLYTSPHLINFNERIRVNGVTITDEEIIIQRINDNKFYSYQPAQTILYENGLFHNVIFTYEGITAIQAKCLAQKDLKLKE